MKEKISLSVSQFKRWLDENKSYVLIDVREDWERDIACLAGDIHIPLATFRSAIENHPKDKTYVIYCHHGRRSLAAAILMKDAGFNHVFNLEGGVSAWADEIDKNMPKY